MLLHQLPVDIVAEILGHLDLRSLINMSHVSRRLHCVASDESMNPWRRPIQRNLRSACYEDALKHLSVRSTVPRANWIEILSIASPAFILFSATLPNLPAADWEECYRRRFLPGWLKYKKEASWKEAFLKVLHRVWHRSVSSCTADEAWTKYVVLNRNGSANELEVSSRTFNPVTIFNEMKIQSNLAHLETQTRVVLQLADVRIVSFGVRAKARSNLSVNPNAHIFLNPPGIEGDRRLTISTPSSSKPPVNDHGVYPMSPSLYIPTYLIHEYSNPTGTYRRLTHPKPSFSHEKYPFFTPCGSDSRWSQYSDDQGETLYWMGGLMLFAQILPANHHNEELSHRQYASFGWPDLWAIAPWMEERITKRIDGAGLGN